MAATIHASKSRFHFLLLSFSIMNGAHYQPIFPWDIILDKFSIQVFPSLNFWQLEKEAIKCVCGKQKTRKSGWEVGVEPVFRKKDIWKKSAVESSQRNSSESNEDLRNHVKTLTNFIISKFPE
ncbi:hypothetical protein QVD17_17840 [Tagetes erecta]|uniref:Uncharacterized protein n=1 Tax=Tagetes erecta TaxID=13708 RepID=A0AAD8KGD7_TARER|nr:hypothetical protein QVD17_17840 [Tagetes erecta]